MNFTREPIIETIITPKEGYKLLVRNSKISSQEEHLLDVVEVVTFNHFCFYRSQERPKPFLVPVSDYELIEVKETKVSLKAPGHDRSIKIGGGREAPVRTRSEPREEPAEEASSEEQPSERRGRERRRRDRRRREPMEEKPKPSAETEQGGDGHDETKVSSPQFTHLLPPPPTLISQTIARYKDSGALAEPLPPPKVAEEEKPTLGEEG